MQLYDTRHKAIVPFTPAELVKIYTCGITPYDAAHVGHAAMVLTYDVLQRRLRDLGHATQLVRNVTDIDDPLFEKARQLGIDWKELGDRETAAFDECMRALDVLPAFSEPRATDSIHDVLGFIGMLLESDHAYQADGEVYFDVNSWDRFGEISNLSRDEMLPLAAERGGNPDDPAKRNALDFVLWQKSRDDEPSWPSMWGPGRPGWHIECSALSMRELGTTIDLHGGGSDLIFPHHECEAAQSEAVTGRPFVKHWMHTAMVRKDGEKMSKSLGNLIFVRDLLKQWDARAVRLALIGHHYRVEWEWSDRLVPMAAARLAKWAAASRGESDSDALLGAVRAALDNDLDTPTAIELMDEAAAKGSGVSRAAALLGVEL